MAKGLLLNADVSLDLRNAEKQWKRFERTTARTPANGLGRITANVKDFDKSLGAATNRVVAFGAAAAVFTAIQRSTGALLRSIKDVEQGLTRINVNLGQSADGIKRFGSQLFDIARQTGQTFEVAASAAEELARQGLGAEETLKRLKDSLILARIAGVDSATAVEYLTAAINTFNNEALTSTEIINKFVAVDTAFAVSSKDLAEGISRVGSTAASSGVSIDELTALITSLQQTTARGGAVISNALKTIFTRITASGDVINALEGIGVAVSDNSGNLRSAIDILKDYSRARLQVGEVERAELDKIVAGVRQINILKAAISDLSREYSVYDSALQKSVNASDEAIRKNEQLNKTIAALINDTAVSTKEFFAALGNVKVGGFMTAILEEFKKLREFLSGDSGSKIGEALGSGILSGLANVLTGPALAALVAILGRSLGKVFATIGGDIRGFLQINTLAQKRTVIQERINNLYNNATALERKQISNAATLLAQKNALLRVQERLTREQLLGTSLQNTFIGRGPRGARIEGLRGFADPIASAIAKESSISGLPKSQIYLDSDPRVATFSNPAGILVANKRDEPLGGFQGVNRVINGGGNPKLGSVPGFAQLRAQDLPRSFGKAERAMFNQRLLEAGRDKTLDKFGSLTDYALKIKDPDLQKILLRKINEGISETLGAASQASSAKMVTGRSRRTNVGQARFRMKGGNVAAAQVLASQQGGVVVATDRRDVRLASQVGINQPPVMESFLDQQARDAKAKEIRTARRERDRALAEQRKIARSQKWGNRSLGAAFALPFLAGFVPQGTGGTGSGIGLGALSGAAQGAGIGGIFGPLGLAIGGLGGGLVGAFGKLTKSVEEFNRELDNATQKEKDNLELVQRISAFDLQAKEATTPDAIRRVAEQRQRAIQSITDPKLKRRIQEGFSSEDEQRKFEYELEQSISRRTASDELRKLAFSSSKKGTLGNISDFLSKGATSSVFEQIGIKSPVVSFLDRFNPLTRLLGGAVGVTSKVFENPMADVLAGQGFAGQVSQLFNKDNISSVDNKSLISLLGIDNVGQKEISQVKDIFKGLGAEVEVTDQNFKELVNALIKGKNSFINLEKEVEKVVKRSTDLRRPLSERAFLTPLNQDVLAGAGKTSINRKLGAGPRGMINFDFYRELASSDPELKKFIERDPAFKRARAQTQQQNIGQAAFSYLLGAGGLNTNAIEQYYTKEGGYNQKNILSALRGFRGGDENQVRILSNLLQKSETTVNESIGRGYRPLETASDKNKVKPPGEKDWQSMEKALENLKEASKNVAGGVKFQIDGAVDVKSSMSNQDKKELEDTMFSAMKQFIVSFLSKEKNEGPQPPQNFNSVEINNWR